MLKIVQPGMLDKKHIWIMFACACFLSACGDRAEDNILTGGDVKVADVVELPVVKITDARIANITEYGVEIEFSYQYDDKKDSLIRSSIVELIPEDGIRDKMLVKMSGVIQNGKGSRRVHIERPRSAVEEFRISAIKVTLGSRSGDGPFAEKLFDIPVEWSSTLAENYDAPLDYWSSNVGAALMATDYAALDRMFGKWNDTALRNRDGEWRLASIKRTLYLMTTPNNWELIHGKIAEWKEHSPGRPGPAIIEASYWIAYAWNARGKGSASQVTDVGMRLFKERLARAEDVLGQSKSYAAENPLWYYMSMRAALGLGRDKGEILKLFKEAITGEPGFHLNYFAAAHAFSPQWGGDYRLMGLVARSAEEVMEEDDSNELYARVYWYMDSIIPDSVDYFSETPVEWERMKRGFKRMLVYYPDSMLTLNAYAAFACRAGDAETYLEIRPRVSLSTAYMRNWKSEFSPDVCDHTFMNRS